MPPDRPLNLLQEPNILMAGSCDVPVVQLPRGSVENTQINCDPLYVNVTYYFLFYFSVFFAQLSTLFRQAQNC